MPYNKKFQKEFLKALDKSFGSRAIRPDLEKFKSIKFSSKEIDEFARLTIIPNKVKNDIHFLLGKKFIEAAGSSPHISYALTIEGIEYLHRPCWLIRTVKKALENSSIQDIAWLLIAIATFLLALTNYLLVAPPLGLPV